MDYLEKALSKLNGRDFGTAELAHALVRLGATLEQAQEVCVRLTEMGYLQDDRLLLGMARSAAGRKRGPGYLWQRVTLKKMSFTREEVRAVYQRALVDLGGDSPDSTESALVFQEAQRLWPRLSKGSLDGRGLWQAKQKLAARLIRRGFTAGLVFEACEKLGKSGS